MVRLFVFLIFFLSESLVSCGKKSSSDSSNTQDLHPKERKDCLDKINTLRATEKKPALVEWTDALSCSDAEAQSDSVSGKPHGAFGKCNEMAQNECPGYPSVDTIATTCLDQMWAEGPGEPYIAHGHYINMSNSSYTKVACGFYKKADGTVWAVQNFSK